MVKTEQQMLDMLDRAIYILTYLDAGFYKGLSYEQGVMDTLEWILNDDEEPIEEGAAKYLD